MKSSLAHLVQIPKQLHISPPASGPPPYFFGPWLNIRQATQSVLTEAYLRDQYVKTHPGFTDHNIKRGVISTAGRVPAKTRSKWTGPEYYRTIEGQLASFGLGDFEGRQHSGIDVSAMQHLRVDHGAHGGR